ncbi:MAG TPA: 30S ribosome-binding factor RbfA [Candidatus Hydrogenedentes bacterium]|nr:30S ribosome-binding factor RbfA [Candidatus Hydrogenedentota bacterium]HOS03553.1 30S ribosome-binding factor RbfA [Candidatus Hydrogenedentota bacterium]
MSEARAKRVAEAIRKEVADLLQKGLKDPRIGFVSIMDVRVSSDLRYANLYVSVLGSESERKSSLIALRHSAGWIRKHLGKHLRLRFTPELRFFEDDSLDRVFHLEEVFKELHKEEQEGGGLDADHD